MTEVATRAAIPRVLNRPQYRPQLIADLASGKPYAELAEQYGVHTSSIGEFAKKHRAAIIAQQADLENEFAGLWIAKKRARLAAMQDDVEQLDREILALRREIAALRQAECTAGHDVDAELGTPSALAPLRTALAAARKAKLDALRLAGMELGAHRQVVDVNVTTVRYEIVGVADMEALR